MNKITDLNQPTDQEIILTDLIYALTAKCVRINRLPDLLATFYYSRPLIAISVFEGQKIIDKEIHLAQSINWQAQLEMAIEQLEQFIQLKVGGE